MSQLPAAFSSRRRFMQQLAGSVALAALTDWPAFGAESTSATKTLPVNASSVPWFQRTRRWGQTNLTELDPSRFDLAWWREHWRKTFLQGVVINAGGIVAYYPTAVPFHRRASTLGDRDLFGEIRHAAKEDGLALFARMDSNRADKSFYQAHPDWFAHDAQAQPYKLNELYIACVNSPYYDEYMPAILREIATRYHPEGFTDNNWNGPMRSQPCFCENCQRKFRQRTGQGIPPSVDWNSPLYREWITWNYERRTEIWNLFNSVTREAGGPECIWVGMMAGAQNWQSRAFRDDRILYRQTEMIMLDDQHRFEYEGFQHNGEIGKRLHAVGGWEKIIPESMAMYSLADHAFQLASQTGPEVKLWALEGFAGGVQPWWHHIGGVQEDRRMLQTAAPLWQWHRDNEQYLINRRPVTTVGLVWSQRNMDFFGRDEGRLALDDPWNGWMQALVRAHIPYVPLHIDDIDQQAGENGLRLLILPNVGAISDGQVASIRKFVKAGGNLIATGATSLFNEVGEPRSDFALADLFGAHVPANHFFRDETKRNAAARDWSQSYLRIVSQNSGAERKHRNDPVVDQARHEVLKGFEQTDLLEFGSELEALTIEPAAVVPLTYIPAWPVSSVEGAYFRKPSTNIAALVLNESAGGGRVAYLAADLDRRYSKDYLPDHGQLLANIIRWTLQDDVPLRIESPGLVDGHLYLQAGRLVLHLINLTSAGTWRAPVEEFIPIGPLKVSVKLPSGIKGDTLRSLTTNDPIISKVSAGWSHFEIPAVTDHHVVVIS